MPYHGIRPCICGCRKYEFVRDCGRTGIVKCSDCSRAKRVKWSPYITPDRFQPKNESTGERTANARRIEGCMY